MEPAPNHEREILRLATVEDFAVLAAGEVDDDAIAFGHRTLDCLEARALLAQDFDGLIHFGFTDLERRALDLVLGELAHDDVGIDLEHRGERERAFVGSVFRFDAGIARDAQVLGTHLFAERLLHGRADRFAARLTTVGLGDDLQRHLARAEPWHLHRARHALEAAVHLFLDVRQRNGDVDTALERARGYLVLLH